MTNLLRPYLVSHRGSLELTMQVLHHGERLTVKRELEPEAAMRLAADIMEAVADTRFFATVRQPADK